MAMVRLYLSFWTGKLKINKLFYTISYFTMKLDRVLASSYRFTGWSCWVQWWKFIFDRLISLFTHSASFLLVFCPLFSSSMKKFNSNWLTTKIKFFCNTISVFHSQLLNPYNCFSILPSATHISSIFPRSLYLKK